MECNVCGCELIHDENLGKSQQKSGLKRCNKCKNSKYNEWRNNNLEHVRTQRNSYYGSSMSYNKECPLYLGVHVAEAMLADMFDEVERMPNGHPGYDFICGKNKKIDVKAATSRTLKGKWVFATRGNVEADYFLCVAYDNREKLNPLHIWLIPNSEVTTKSITITHVSLNKYEKYIMGGKNYGIKRNNICRSRMWRRRHQQDTQNNNRDHRKTW